MLVSHHAIILRSSYFGIFFFSKLKRQNLLFYDNDKMLNNTIIITLEFLFLQNIVTNKVKFVSEVF